MAGLVGFLIVGAFVGATVIYMWPLFLMIAALWLGIHWALKWDDRRTAARKARQKAHTAILERAYTQHHQILDGELQKGTYGQYMPPKGLRRLP